MIFLSPMNETEFAVYIQRDIAHFAEENVKAGNWNSDEALDQ
jgi:hypothetical protein